MKKDISIYPNSGIWNSYIFINNKILFPREFKKVIANNIKVKTYTFGSRRKFLDYYSLEYLFDMSGGLTYCEKMYNDAGKWYCTKVGNDYNHIWNGGENLESITIDLKTSIDRFIEQFPRYRVWSVQNGKFIVNQNIEAYNAKKTKEYANKTSKNSKSNY